MRINPVLRASTVVLSALFIVGACSPAVASKAPSVGPSVAPSVMSSVEPSVEPSTSAEPSVSVAPSVEPSSALLSADSDRSGALPPGVKIPAGTAGGELSGNDKTKQDSSYHYWGYDRYNVVKGPVTADGYMLWYKTNISLTSPLPYWYGAFYKEYVWATSPVACIYFQVTWNKLTGSVSLPPGGSVSGEGVSDGMYQSCRTNGFSYPPYFILGGANPIDFSSRALEGATLKVCYSNSPNGVKYCSSAKHYN